MLHDFRCGQCNRLLARADGPALVQIKCPRCATLNHMKAMRLDDPPPSEQHGTSSPHTLQAIQ
ncbi:MAG: Com family DNA-binding transcriptional regulator [Paucimonas sp.]|uniref:Com family DNA-binding transcriptional regulator n=1 Tax=Pantoea sp. Cy-639 TaxID=2608360 RepID=UPI0014236C11|nr:Com family DNA-binding transcriptional regulator [Paucimonas sp.]NIF16152.1 Com family DNA-binding transcriptional regulator [Pantoea sp. Cy-639]